MHASYHVLSFNNNGFQTKSEDCYWFNLDTLIISINSQRLSIN